MVHSKTPATLVASLFTILFLMQGYNAYGTIVITYEEEQCLEKTGKLFEDAGQELLEARQEFTTSMDMQMSSKSKMYATYPDDQLKNYDNYCTKYGGKMHTIKIDFFDCVLKRSTGDIELTLKNFANCMAPVSECEGFGQEHLLQEAWAELGLVCVLEEEETKKDPPKGKNNNVDDDFAKKEKEAAAGGADDVDKEEEKSEYIPKEQQNKFGKRKKGGFVKFVLFLTVCGMGYFVFDRHRRGLPIELPAALSSRLPFGGAPTSRFARRPHTGFVSDYNLISPEDNSLQLSSNLT